MQTRILSWAKKQRVSEVTNMNRSDHIIRNMFCWCLCLLLVSEKWFLLPSELWHFPLTRNEKVCLLLCEYKTFIYSLIFCSQFLTSAFPIDIWKWLHLHHRVIRVYPLISLLSYINIDPVCCKEWPHYLHWK